MSEVWDTLITIQDRLMERFDATGHEVYEPGMDRFNQPGWINRVWSSDNYRRAHVDVVDVALICGEVASCGPAIATERFEFRCLFFIQPCFRR